LAASLARGAASRDFKKLLLSIWLLGGGGYGRAGTRLLGLAANEVGKGGVMDPAALQLAPRPRQEPVDAAVGVDVIIQHQIIPHPDADTLAPLFPEQAAPVTDPAAA
jgi:hypothetical protein